MRAFPNQAMSRGLADPAARADDGDDTAVEFFLRRKPPQLGFLKRTPRGRVATARAYEHMGIPYNVKGDQQSMF